MTPKLVPSAAWSRRHLLKGSLGAGVAAATAVHRGVALAAGPQDAATGAEGGAGLPPTPAARPLDHARHEAYWSEVAALYRVDSRLVNLENGFFGVMPQPVLAQYHRHIDQVNERNSVYLRQDFARELEAVRARIAAVAGVLPEEIALTRGATEALQNLIVNYRGLKLGDTVLYADLDYDSAQANVDYLKERRGVSVARFAIPEPATHQSVLDAYARAFIAHPRARLLLLTHVSHKTGLVLPVAEITRMARARGIDVILDAAHSWGQLDFKVPQLGVDFAAFNLHKWMGAPLGVGFLYIRKDRLADIDPHLIPGEPGDASDIRSRVHTGTTNTANVLTVPAALDFHERIGAAHKAARLRYLRDRWVSWAGGFRGVQILTPDDPRLYGAITSFRLAGRTSRADNVALAQRLRDQYGVFTVARGGIASGDCVRVTPALSNSPAHLDRLVAALQDITRRA